MSQPTSQQESAILGEFEKKGILLPSKHQAVDSRIGASESFPGPPDGFPVHAYWWGWNFYISGPNVTWLGAAVAVGSSGVGILASLILGIPVVNVFAWVLAGYIFAEAAAILAINGANGGRGVYISMSWFAPLIFVPTSA